MTDSGHASSGGRQPERLQGGAAAEVLLAAVEAQALDDALACGLDLTGSAPSSLSDAGRRASDQRVV